jgi:hypothetical protein
MNAKSETALATVPKPAQIDALILEYNQAKAEVDALKATMEISQAKADAIKVRLIEMVKKFGGRHTEKSMKLAGLHNEAMVTTGTRTTTDAAAVEKLRAYLGTQEIPGLSTKFFTEHVTYSLVDGPTEVLRTLDIPTRIRTKIKSLLGVCFTIVTNAPSLKVTVTEAEKPARSA